MRLLPGTRRLSLDLWEIVLIAVLVIVAARAIQMRRDIPYSPELLWLRDAYGPDRFSQYAEEWIVRDFFQDRRDGFFVDVGAAHYRTFSNTWRLESDLGWAGIAVDAQESFRADYERYRPKTRFHTFFVNDRSDEHARLFLNRRPWAASSDESFTSRFGAVTGERQVPTITLTDLLDQEGVTTFDFLSMDIELAEVKALAGFDIERFKPRLVCIEGQPEIRQALLDYFARREYVLVGKYLRLDDRNMYFMRDGEEPPPPFPDEVMERWSRQE